MTKSWVVTAIGIVLGLGTQAFAQNTYPSPFGPASSETIKLGDGLYTFRYGGTRTIFIVTDEGVITADPINTWAAPALKEAIAEITDQPVKYVIYSHQHWDHVLGGSVFKEDGATFISHRNCITHFTRTPNDDLVMPDITFERSYTVTLGGRSLELMYFGMNHGDCLVVMRIPEERMLFVVDLATPGSVPGAGGVMWDTHPLEWARSLREIEALDTWDVMIPGHGPPTVPRSAMTEVREYLEALMGAVRHEIETGTPFNDIAAKIELPQFKHLRGYDQYITINADRVLSYYVGGL